jgi:hypothetical protein
VVNYNYLDFDLGIESLGDGRYRARVIDSPSGQARGEFSVPFSAMELENFLLRIGRPRANVRRLESPETEAARTFGTKMFDAVFAGEVGMQWRRSVDAAERDERGLRLRLRLADAPELRELPWEYLYSSAADRFIALSTWTPVVRHVSLDRAAEILNVTPPLKMLAMVSSPTDAPGLDVDAEWERLSESLADVVAAGLIEVTSLENATLRSLQRAIRDDQFHVFHFIGHGGFDESSQDGVLLLEDERGRAREVTGRELGTILTDQRSMRLAVLNACEGARTSVSDPFAGAAHSLILCGIPAVVAMQFEITDAAAIVFAHEFYAAVADGLAVDAAITEARRAIFGDAGGVEWGTPVLHLRTDDGRLFSIDPSLATPAPDAPVVAPAAAAERAEGVAAQVSDQEPEIEISAPVDRNGGTGTALDDDAAPVGPVASSRLPDEPVEPQLREAQPDALVPEVAEPASAAPAEPAAPPAASPAVQPPAPMPPPPQQPLIRRLWPIIGVGLVVLVAIFFMFRETDEGSPEGGGTTAATTVDDTGVDADGRQQLDSPDVTAVRFASAPQLDGDLSDWSGVTEFITRHRIFDDDIAGSRLGSDSVGTVMVGFDDANLYLAYQVDDDRYDQRNTGNQIFRGDAVDVNLFAGPVAAAPTRPDAATFQLTLTPDAAGTGPAGVRFTGTGDGFGPNTTELPVAVAIDGAGPDYVMEAAVPWAVFGLNGPPDGTIPALFAVFDNDGEDDGAGRPAQTAIMANVDESGIFQRPQQWGSLSFEG